jgi:hypothetical protein
MANPFRKLASAASLRNVKETGLGRIGKPFTRFRYRTQESRAEIVNTK